MSEVPTGMDSTKTFLNLNVVPPSDDSNISPPISGLNELNDDFFIEVILANKGSDNARIQNPVEHNINGNIGNPDFNMIGPHSNFSQLTNGEDEEDPPGDSSASRKKGRPLGSKNKKKNGETLTPLTGPLLNSSS